MSKSVKVGLLATVVVLIFIGLISIDKWLDIRIKHIDLLGISITYTMLLVGLIWLLLKPMEGHKDIMDQGTAYEQRVKGILGILVMTIVFSISLVAFSSIYGGEGADERNGAGKKGSVDQLIEFKTRIKAESGSDSADSGEKAHQNIKE